MSQAPSPSTAAATFPEQDWDNGTFGIQSWLRRTAWRTLRDTDYGVPKDAAPPHPALHDDPLLRQVYYIDVALFLSAEETSYKAVSGMVRAAPSELAQMALATQTLDEARHFEVFSHRLAHFGVTPDKRAELVARYTTRAMRSFYDLVLEQVDRRDFYASSIAQNLILEGMAYPIYRYEIKYWSRFDPGLAKLISGAFADEVHHVGFGEAINASHMRRLGDGERARIQRLTADFHKLMREVFEEVISHYVGLYQECANQYTELVGDIEIFPGYTLATLTEEEQIRLLLKEIEDEHATRLARIGFA